MEHPQLLPRESDLLSQAPQKVWYRDPALAFNPSLDLTRPWPSAPPAPSAEEQPARQVAEVGLQRGLEEVLQELPSPGVRPDRLLVKHVQEGGAARKGLALPARPGRAAVRGLRSVRVLLRRVAPARCCKPGEVRP